MQIGLCAAIGQLGGVDLRSLDYLEPPVGATLVPGAGGAAFAEQAAALARLGIKAEVANFFLPGELKTTGPAVDQPRLDRYVRTAFERAARLGIGVIVFGSGASRKVPEGFAQTLALEQLADHLRRWAPWAQQAGIRLAVEALNRRECNIINSLDEAAELIRRADLPAGANGGRRTDGLPVVGIVVDTYHMAIEGESPSVIARHADLILHAHCADQVGRVPLGLGPSDHRPYFAALRSAGYDGRVSIEANWQDLGTQLQPAVTALLGQFR